MHNSPDRTQRAYAAVWNVQTGELLYPLPHSKPVKHLKFTADGLHIVSCDLTSILVCNANSGEKIRALKYDRAAEQDEILCCAISPDGSYIATADKYGVMMWTPTDPQEVEFSACFPFSVAVSTNGGRLACLFKAQPEHDFYREPLLFVRDAPDGWNWRKPKPNGERREQKIIFKTVNDCSNVLLSADGRYVSTYCDRMAIVYDLKYDNAERMKLLHSVDLMAFDPLGKQVAAVFEGGVSVCVLSLEPPVELFSLRGCHFKKIRAITFSPDGGLLATASDDATAKVWNAHSGEEVLRITHDGSVSALCFSPDGTQIATVGDDGVARSVDVRSRREVLRLELSSSLGSVCFSPDGYLLAAAAGPTNTGFEVIHQKREIEAVRDISPRVDDLEGFVDIG